MAVKPTEEEKEPEVNNVVELKTSIGVGEDLIYEVELSEPTVEKLLAQRLNFADIATAKGVIDRVKVCTSIPDEYFKQLRMRDITVIHERIEELGFFH